MTTEKNNEIINSFPGYEYVYSEKDKQFHNMYRGTDVGRGGYIISTPGIYTDVALIDVASMHPSSIIAMNYFGKHTERYKEIREARVAIKHGDFDKARTMLDGKLAKYLTDESMAKNLSNALKLPLNQCYGLTAASFDNPFRDIRNKNNIVALRGALFMRTLQDEVESRGFKIVAIKTDSIKIANATKEIIDFCMEFANKYGYTFEHEATYERMCQINDADYVAFYADKVWCQLKYGYTPGENEKHPEQWTVTGARFAQPYVFKTLFSKEPIEFEDLCEAKEVKTAMYLYLDEESADNSPGGYDAYRFIGKVGQFCPMKPGYGGGTLLRQGKDKDGNTTYSAVTGTKGYLWMESEMVKTLEKEEGIDKSYYTNLVDAAVATIEQYGDVNWFCGN